MFSESSFSEKEELKLSYLSYCNIGILSSKLIGEFSNS